jgi:putative ABC transport system ATP-binding protein
MTNNKLKTQTSQLTTVPQTVIIRLENIFKVYGSGETEVRAIDDVNLTIEEGEYCSIMGPSGSGKSTAMNIIGCLDRPTSGHYYLDNVDVAQMNDTDLAHIRNKKLGFVFQQFHLLPQLSAIENVMLPMVYAGVKSSERRDRAAEALKRVGLEKRFNNKPNQLSGGQQQRVAIARAIVTRPDVARQTRRIVWFRDGQIVHSNLTPSDLTQMANSH